MRLSIGVTRWGMTRRQELHGSALSYSESAVLYFVQNGVTTPGMIAKRVHLTARAVTGIVDRLEQQGLLLREHDQVDRRRVQLVLTPEGRDAVDFVEHDVLAPLIQKLEELDPADREALERGMAVLSSMMDDMGATDV